MTTAYFAAEAVDLCAKLTPSQRGVLVLLAKGLTRNDAAQHLSIARSTLDGHQKAIHRVLDVETTIEAAVIAAKAGLV